MKKKKPLGPTAQFLRDTALLVADPRRAFLEQDENGLIRIRHSRQVNPHLPIWWQEAR